MHVPFRPMKGWAGMKENAPAADLVHHPAHLSASRPHQGDKRKSLVSFCKAIFSRSPFSPFHSEPSRFLILALDLPVTVLGGIEKNDDEETLG